MNRLIMLFLLVPSLISYTHAQTKAAVHTNYGANAAAGGTFAHDGVRLYYEVYGSGAPLLVVHGNGGSIADMAAQIDFFRQDYKVIAMDSRDQGRSGDSQGKLTYEKMADDLAALLDHLAIDRADVLGWSDGGIQALLLAIRHPTKVKKIAVMGAALNPTEEAVYPEVIGFVKSTLAEMATSFKATPRGRRELKVTQMLLDEPHIPISALERIAVPTLVMAGDHDLIRDEHTIEIYHHIRQSQLAIFPNATHMIPFDDPATFNATLQRFFGTQFVKRDRLKDLLSSLDRMRALRAPTPQLH
jgi:pimeloyl-ACP methyl ester carboxylesterase